MKKFKEENEEEENEENWKKLFINLNS